MRRHYRKWNLVLAVSLVILALLSGCGQQFEAWQHEVKELIGVFGSSKNDFDGDAARDDASDADIFNADNSGGEVAGQQGQSDADQQAYGQSVTEQYAYENLSKEAQQCYDKMLSAILKYEEKVILDIPNTNLMKKAYTALSSDHGELFWVSGYSFTRYTKGGKLVALEFAPNYTMDEAEMEVKQRQVDGVVAEWLAGCSVSASDYEKAKYVFETLTRKVDYVEGAPDSQNILSVFLNRQTVCQGYASATQYLLRQLGVASTIITGEADDGTGGGLHAWNLVKLDGSYYYMDTTWGNGSYHTAENGERGEFVNYNYMCMTDAEAENFYQPDTQIPLPECSSIEHNYYVREGKYFESWDPEAIGVLLREAWESGNETISIKCVNRELCEKVKDYFITQEKIADYCRRIKNFYYMESPEFCVMTVNF